MKQQLPPEDWADHLVAFRTGLAQRVQTVRDLRPHNWHKTAEDNLMRLLDQPHFCLYSKWRASR